MKRTYSKIYNTSCLPAIPQVPQGNLLNSNHLHISGRKSSRFVFLAECNSRLYMKINAQLAQTAGNLGNICIFRFNLLPEVI